MAKDKLITLLIEEEKRDRLKQHCAELGLNVSQVLSKCIDDILNGLIDPYANWQTPIPPIDIDIAIDTAIDKFEPKLIDIVEQSTSQINTKLKGHDDDIHELENALYSCQTMIRTLTKLVNKQGIAKLELDPTTKQALAHTVKPEPIYKTHSSDEIYLDPQRYTLEDTRIYLQGKGDYNRTREKMSDRISQDDIATHLRACNYPHPENRKWTRDEVRKVFKLWSIATKQ
jgi:hypothetical protein